MPKRKKSNRFSRMSLNRRVRLVAFALVSIIISTFVLVGISLYKFVNAPFSSASNVVNFDSKHVWKNDSTILILVQLTDRFDQSSNIEKLGFIRFNVITGRYELYKVPIDVEIDYALGYGKGTFRDIYKRGDVGQNMGLHLLSKTIFKTFGVKTDGYIEIDNDGYSQIINIIGDINDKDLSSVLRVKNFTKMPRLFSTFRSVAITNMNITDIKNVIGFIRHTSETSGTVVELTKYHLLDEDKWDELWQSNLDVSDVKKEAIKVFVANASKGPKIPGLAKWGARIVQNLGASILDTQNSFVDFDENTIITDDTGLITVQKLVEILGIKNVVYLNDIDKNSGINPQVFRTRITLVLVSY